MTVKVQYANEKKDKVLEVVEVNGEKPIAQLADGESYDCGMVGIEALRLREVDPPTPAPAAA